MKRISRERISEKNHIGSVILVVFSVAAVSRSASVPVLPSQMEHQNRISVTSELVALPVSVTDAQGNFIAGLQRDNFRVYENNQPRDITLFEQEDTAASVGLLVDHSTSMASKLANVVTAISGFTHSSNPQDEMFVVDFSDDAKFARLAGGAFTSNPAEIEKAISASADGRTALYDAVAAGLNHLQEAHWKKRALVIISDGGDNASGHKYSEVLAEARESQVAIYSVGLVDESGEEENPKILEQLSKDTGGIVFFPHTGSEVVDATAHIARDLREQYMLGFVPGTQPTGDPFRKIRVEVIAPHHGKLHVRTRAGYFEAGLSTISAKPKGDTP